MAKKPPAPIPYRFFLDAIEEELVNKAFFGARAYYRDEAILFILREKPDSFPADNGIWVATHLEHHASLKSELPSLRSLEMFGGDTSWQVLPADSDGFEDEAFRLAELVQAADPRIGRIPKGRRRLTKKAPEGTKKPAAKKATAKAPKKTKTLKASPARQPGKKKKAAKKAASKKTKLRNKS